jgi:hypothetical protein
MDVAVLGISGFLCLRPVGFGFGCFVTSQVTLVLGLIRLAVLLEERRGIFVDHGGLVMNGRRMLMGRRMPLLMTGLFAVTFTHNC